MNRIKKGDEVIVISGRDKGKRGAVLRRIDDEHRLVYRLDGTTLVILACRYHYR